MSTGKLISFAVKGAIAGAVGTAAMTAAYATEHRLRPSVQGQLDYDDSLVPGQIVADVLHLGPVTELEKAELKTLLLWGYGSAFGMAGTSSSRARWHTSMGPISGCICAMRRAV